MAENCLKWSCNHRKTLKVLSSIKEYRERIGYKLNSTWYLRIQSRKRLFDNGESYEPFWKFIVETEDFTGSVKVTVRLISNIRVYIDKELSFNSEKKSDAVDHYFDIDKCKGNPFDIIFIFQQDIVSENVSSKLKDDLLFLLQKGLFTDVTLKCGSECIKAHKAVVCARSSVMATMFQTSMQERDSNTVTISDIDPSVFKAWIHFVYGDEVQITSIDFACHLLYAAEKYQMARLKEICIHYLEFVLSKENALKLLEIAYLYDDNFRKTVIYFIEDNYPDIRNSEEWISLKSNNPALALKYYEEVED